MTEYLDKYYTKRINRYKARLINKHENNRIDNYKTKYIKKYILQLLPQVQPLHHSHAILALPQHRLHAASTPPHTVATRANAALTPLPRSPVPPSRRSHAAPTPPQRCCNAAPTPSPHRHTAAATSPQRHLHAAARSPHTALTLRCMQLSRRSHDG